MKRLLIAAAAAATLIAVPAMADDLFVGADQSGVGVQVGPFGLGIGPRFSGDPTYRDGYYRDGPYRDGPYATDGYYVAPSGECQLVREQVVTPSGRVIYRQHRICE